MESVNIGILPALASSISDWFPELGRRVLPVAEANITKDNIPTLPICMLALMKEESTVSNGHSKRLTIREDFLVEFWFKPERYKKSDNSETPFWSYYDYDTLRDKFLTHLRGWLSPRGQRIEYVSLQIEADTLAVIITFRFRHEFAFCDVVVGDEDEGRFVQTSLSITPGCSMYCPEDDCEKEPVINPCTMPET